MLSRLQLIISSALLPIWLIAANTNSSSQNTNQNQQGQGQGQQQQPTKYYCPVSKEYKEYKNGNGKLEAIPSFTNEKTCESQCLSQGQCMFVGAQSNGIVIAKVADGKKLDLAKINKELAGVKKITGIKIVVSNVEALSVSDLNGISVKELFVPVKQSDIKKEGIKANVSGNNLTLTDLGDGGKLIEITSSKLTKNTENGTYTAEHLTRKKKVPMTQDEINKLTPQQRAQYEEAYQKALEAYNSGKSTYKPIGAFVKDGGDEQYTLITAENGKLSEQAGWVPLAPLAGVSYNASQVSFETEVMNVDGTTKKETITISLNGSGQGEYLFTVDGTTKNTIQVGQDTLVFNSSVKDPKDLSNITYSVEKIAGNITGNRVSGEFEVEILSESTGNRYMCQGNDKITGDLGKNAFSDEKACATQCKLTNACVTINQGGNGNNGCKVLSSQLLNPITDVNGKTIYLSKKVTEKCTIIVDKQIGCRQYSTQTSETPDLEKLLGGIPKVQTNKQNHDFSKATEAFGQMGLMEASTHIFGAEASYCDTGQFLPTPMDLVAMAIKYATMAFSAGSGGVMDDALNAGGNAFANGTGNVVSKSAQAAMSALKAGFSKFASNFAKKTTEEMIKHAIRQVSFQVVAKVVTTALQQYCDSEGIKGICDKKEKQRQSAWTTGSTDGILTNEQLDGATDEEDKVAMDYANCMSGRFGLTYEAVLAWQMGTREVNELHYSFKVPMIIDGNELGTLRIVMENEKAAAADIDKYFYARYNVEESGKVNGKTAYALYALKGEDALIAAETICGGPETVNIIRQKYGKRFLDPKLANPTVESEVPKEEELKEELPGLTEDSNDPSKKTDPVDVAVQAAEMIASALPTPWNFVANAVIDLLKQVQENGDTCTDMKFAERRAQKTPIEGEEYIRTNKRISLGLCTHVSSEDMEKIGKVVLRKRKHHCCYDQITTRIFAEGMMAQLGKRATKDNCAPLGIDDLNKVSFKSCKAGQKPEKDNCFPADKFQELTNAYMSGANIGIDEAVSGIVNSVFQLDESQ